MKFLSLPNGGFARTQRSSGGLQLGRFINLPPLSMAIQGSAVVLSWPTNFGAEYTLQSTVNLGAAGWTTFNLAQPPVVGDAKYVVTIPNGVTNDQQYYRLKQ